MAQTPTTEPPPPPPASKPPAPSIPYLITWDLSTVRAPATLRGRALPVERITRAVTRLHDPVAVLLADAGSGKSAVVRWWAASAMRGEIPPLAGYSFVQLDIAAILTDVVLGKIGTAAVEDTLVKASKLERTIVVVDDLHLLAGQPGYGVTPGVNDMIACFRPLILWGALRAVLTSVPKEFETKLGADPVISRRTTVLYLDELAGDVLRQVIREAAAPLAEHHTVTITDEAYEQAAVTACEPAMSYRPPASAVRLLDDACAAARARGDSTVSAAAVKEAARSHPEVVGGGWDRPRLRALEAELGKRVLGQPEAVKAVAKRIRLTKLQLDRKPQRPDGVFLFLGPSGVGKTELAKALALALYGDLSRLVRIDMSEYAEQHEYAKMIGSPPGYLGYGEEGHLTGPIAKLGHAVVLFDEVEKAHANCHRLMLQLFDEGVLTDGKGKRVDFSQCVIIMTSNIGRDLWADEKNGLGFAATMSPTEPSAKAVLDYLLKTLPSEFVNRIDDLVPFRTFQREDMVPIAQKMMLEEKERWDQKGKRLVWEDAVIDRLVDTGYNARLGARHLGRNIEKLVSQLLSEAACEDDWPDVTTLRLLVRDGNVVLEREHRDPAASSTATDSTATATTAATETTTTATG
jgi:ATP-dependent Clp protease ATP-binding subunit ClpC